MTHFYMNKPDPAAIRSVRIVRSAADGSHHVITPHPLGRAGNATVPDAHMFDSKLDALKHAAKHHSRKVRRANKYVRGVKATRLAVLRAIRAERKRRG